MRDPINPADIRVGDRVERVERYPEGDEMVYRFTVARSRKEVLISARGTHLVTEPEFLVEWFPPHRPDPLAEVVEVMAPALMVADLGPDAPAWDRVRDEARDDWRRMAREALAAITERWELVERGKP